MESMYSIHRGVLNRWYTNRWMVYTSSSENNMDGGTRISGNLHIDAANPCNPTENELMISDYHHPVDSQFVKVVFTMAHAFLAFPIVCLKLG